MFRRFLFLIFISFMMIVVYPAKASYVPINVGQGINIGIGTATPQTALAVSGNIGIGTWTAAGGNLIIKGSGNVGIGSAWPGAILDVSGNTRTSTLSVTGNVGIGTTLQQTAFAVNNGNVGIGTWTAAGGNLIVNGGGNVGIGSAWPGKTLDVSGTVRMTSFVLTTSPSNGYVLTSDASGNGSWTAPSAGSSQWFTASGLGIGTYDKVGLGTNLTAQTAKLAIVGGNVGIGTVDAQGAFVVTNGNVGIGTWVTTQLFQINSASTSAITMTSGGNVGIGTTLPTVKLAVIGAQGIVGDPTYIARVLLTNDSASQTLNNSGGIEFRGASSSNGYGFRLNSWDLGGGNVPFVWESRNNSATWTERMRLTLGGNLGIGTGTVNNQLVVNGALSIGTANSSFVTTTAPSGGMIVEGNVGLGTVSPQTGLVSMNNVGIGTWTAAGGNLIIKGGGNVGIGSAWPGAILDVSGNTRTSTLSVTGNVGIGTTLQQTAFAVNNGNVGIGTWTAAGGNLIVNGGGNVGIGSAWPGVALDVNGTVRASGFSTTAGVAAGWTNSAGKTYVTTGSDNVGIGTTTPQAKVSVVGGNVGIGTWTANKNLLGIAGGVGIGTTYNVNYSSPNNGLVVEGNVGVGTWIPRFIFETNGSISMGGHGGINNSIIFDDNGTSNRDYIGLDDSGVAGLNSSGVFYLASDTSLSVTASVPTAALSAKGIYSSDNVGIGTWTPLNRLTVVGGGVGIGTNINSSFVRTTTDNGGMIVEGNVGIGSYQPQGKLEVNSSPTATSGSFNNQYNFTFAAPGSTSSAIYNGFNSTMYFLGDGSGGASLRGVNGITALISGDITTNYGLLFYAQSSTTGTVGANYGGYAASVNASSGTITNAIGSYGAASNESNGNVTNAYGIAGAYSNNGSGTTASAFGGSFSVTRSAGTITSGYGVFVGNVEATSKWSIYASDTTAPIYLGANVGINTTTPGTKLDIMSVDNGTGMRVLIPATSANVTAADTFVSFNSSQGQIGTIAGSASSGVIAYNTFTGSHWTRVEDEKDVFNLALLCSTGEVVDWAQEQLTKTRLCNKANDPAVLGAYGGRDNQGHDLALSIGTGYLLVVNKGKDLEVGDYLTSSDVKGYAQKQHDNIYRNYTAGKLMQPIQWKENERFRKVAVIYEGG